MKENAMKLFSMPYFTQNKKHVFSYTEIISAAVTIPLINNQLHLLAEEVVVNCIP